MIHYLLRDCLSFDKIFKQNNFNMIIYLQISLIINVLSSATCIVRELHSSYTINFLKEEKY